MPRSRRATATIALAGALALSVLLPETGLLARPAAGGAQTAAQNSQQQTNGTPSGAGAAPSIPFQQTTAPQAKNGAAQTPPPQTKSSQPPASPAKPAGDSKKAKIAYTHGRDAEEAKNWREAFADYAEAARDLPDNQEYAVRRDVARSQLVQGYVNRAERDAVSGRMTDARADLSAAIALDPGDTIARERWNQLSLADAAAKKEESAPELAEPVQLAPAAGTRNINYRGDTQGAYQEIARLFGVHATFDVDLSSRRVHLEVPDVDFHTAMKVLGNMTATFWRPIAPGLFFVAQDTPQKRKDYEPSVTRTFLLPDSSSQDDVTEIVRAIRELTGITRTQIDNRTRTLTLRAPPSAIALAGQLIEELEAPRGQLILDIDILEVSRQVADNFGILPPQSSTLYSISKQEIQTAESGLSGLISVIQQVFGTPSSLSGLTQSQIAGLVGGGQLGIGGLLPPLFAFGGGASTFFGTLPGATANFSSMLTTVRNGQHIKMRAEDGRPATFFVGNRVPVSLAQYSASLGSSENIPNVSSSGFSSASYATGNQPTGIAEAVLRSPTTTVTSQPIDLVTSNYGDADVSVLLGNGDGTFGAKTDFNTGNGPSSIAIADFNNDGIPDLVVTNKIDNTVSILLGNGDGTFKSKMDFPVGTSPVSVVTGNFNADANMDIAVANQGSNNISVLLGNGDGTFQPQVNYGVGGAPTSITAGIFSSNGVVDLAVANQNSASVSVLLGNGNGTFQRQVAYATGNAPVAVQTADVNGDTFLDLAVANYNDDTVSILLGNGNGTFQTQSVYPTTDGPSAIVIADFNEDGLPDLAITESQSDTLSVLLGIGGGAFSAPLDIGVGDDPVAVTSADFNGSGLPDAAVANESSNSATVILNSNAIESLLSSTASGGETGIPYPNVQYLDLGVKIKATPRLHPDNEVSLQLAFEIRSLAGESLNQLPIISNRTIEHTVRLKENETSVLAGILDTQEMHAINGTPGLANVDTIGLLAGDRTTNDSDDELIVLITPRRLNPAPKVSRQLYAGHAPQQGGGSVGQTFEERQPAEQPQPGEEQPQPAAAPPPQPPPQPEQSAQPPPEQPPDNPQ